MLSVENSIEIVYILQRNSHVKHFPIKILEVILVKSYTIKYFHNLPLFGNFRFIWNYDTQDLCLNNDNL